MNVSWKYDFQSDSDSDSDSKYPKKYIAAWQSNNLLDILSVSTYMPDRWNHDLILEE